MRGSGVDIDKEVPSFLYMLAAGSGYVRTGKKPKSIIDQTKII